MPSKKPEIPLYEPSADDGVFVPAYGGWLEDSSPLTENVEGYSPYDTRYTDKRLKEEWEFYNQYYVEYIENEWFHFLVDWLVTELFSDYEFEGPGAEAVYKFFNETCPTAREELIMMGLNVIREGTGMVKKYSVNGDLRQMKAVNGRIVRLKVVDNKKGESTSFYTGSAPDADTSPSAPAQWLQITVDGDQKFKEWMKEWPLEKKEDYSNDRVAICRIKRDPRTPYGIGFGSTCLHAIKGLKDVNRDVLAAIKQNASNLKVVAVDLAEADSDAERLAKLKTVAHAYRRVASATNGVVAIDINNEIYYMGTGAKGQAGSGGGGRILQVMQYMEPVLSAVLMNFLFSIGLIEQEGANKSLIAKQELRAERQMKRYRAAVASFLQTQIIPDITDLEVTVMFEPQMEIVEWIALFTNSAISRERLLREFSIRDEGKSKTYFYQLQPAPAPGSVASTTGGRAKSKGGSNDDNPTPRRQEGRSDANAGRGS
jgi:hypothetical protein